MKTLDYILRYSDNQRIKYRILTTAKNKFKDRIESMGINCDILAPKGVLSSYGGQILNSSLIQKITTIIHLIQYNFSVFRYLKRHDFDIVYCNSIRSILTVGVASKLLGIKRLLYIKGELANPLLDFVSFILANKIVFFSQSNANDSYKYLLRMMKSKIEIVEIGLDCNEIDSVLKQDNKRYIEELGISKKIINIGFCGRISEPKGLNILIKAMKELDKTKTKLYVIGDAIIDKDIKYKNIIHNLINKYNLEDSIIFLGWKVDHLPIVAHMDIMVNPSFAEGFGRNILESMALGKAIIATKTGGLRDVIINGENGFLIPIKDEEQLADKINLLIENKKLREKISKNARETILQNFHIKDKIEKLNSLFYEM